MRDFDSIFLERKCLHLGYLKLWKFNSSFQIYLKCTMSWGNIKSLKNPNYFFEAISILYGNSFFKLNIRANSRKNSKLWVTKGILKSLKLKQKLLWETFIKSHSRKRTKYEDFKNLFEKIEHKCKQNFYSDILIKFKDAKKTWEVMKEIIGKTYSSFVFATKSFWRKPYGKWISLLFYNHWHKPCSIKLQKTENFLKFIYKNKKKKKKQKRKKQIPTC